MCDGRTASGSDSQSEDDSESDHSTQILHSQPCKDEHPGNEDAWDDDVEGSWRDQMEKRDSFSGLGLHGCWSMRRFWGGGVGKKFTEDIRQNVRKNPPEDGSCVKDRKLHRREER
jgi:hypothetical protein